MRNNHSSLSQSESFLPLESSISPEPQSTIIKSPNKHKPLKGKSILFDELKKFPNGTTEQKRSCIIKYLKKQGLSGHLPKVISTVEQEGHAIPMLQVAVALSRYDNQLLKELLDSKTIEGKQNQESQIYELNKKLQSDPILSLLSESEQLKKLPQQHSEPSFVDFKQISPSRKNELIDVEKGKLKKSKSKYISNIEFPQELAELKKQLMSLPYINRYKKQLSLKRHYKQKKEKSLRQEISVVSSRYSGIKNVADLNTSMSNFKNNLKTVQNSIQLEATLKKVLSKRNSSFQISVKDVSLPSIQKLDRVRLKKSLIQIKDDRLSDQYKMENLQTIQDENIRQTGKTSEQNPQDYLTSKKNSQKRKQTIFKNNQKKFWPEYHSFSSYNNKRYLTQVDKLTTKIRSLTQLSEIPSQQTLEVYYSLKKLQKNDLKKLEQQAYDMEKNFTHTKYKIKYNNLKESYSKRLKHFTKDKKVREFQLQESAYQEQKNLTFNQVKINRKILEKMISPKKDSK